MSTYAIGDLQGCAQEFQALLDLIGFSCARDRLWLAGDLVNRGPASLEALRAVRALGSAATTVLGNHDLHLLAAAVGARPLQHGDTFDEILAACDCEALLAWLRTRPLAHTEVVGSTQFLLVHAGVLPQWTVTDTMRYAGEVEATLAGPGWQSFLNDMYGNRPAQWHAELQGIDRLRVIVNALTRLRFCSSEGVMDFNTKEGADAAPAGFMPWFDVATRKSRDVTVVTGHWSTLGLRVEPDHIALDTGCVWGGRLTAVRLEDKTVYSVPCAGYREPGRQG